MNTKGTILVVDDSPTILKLLANILTAEGYEAPMARSGKLALDAVAAQPPDVILLDLCMPGIDGLEVYRRLQARVEGCAIPVVFISANSEGAERAKALKMGAVDFICKPFRRGELLARVQTHLELHRSRVRLKEQAESLRQANEQLQRELAERERSAAALSALNLELQASRSAGVNQLNAAVEAVDRLGTANQELRREIVERKWLEKRLRASEEKFRCLFESSRDAIMTIEPPSWKFTSGNSATVKMFGAKNEEDFISHGPWELSPERQPDGRASQEKAQEMIETALREGAHFFEWTHRRIGGEAFAADVLLTRMERAGEVTLQATVRDITGRKRVEESIQRSNAELEAIYDSTPVMICLVNRQRQVERMNRAMAEFVGGQPSLDTPPYLGDLLGCVNALDDPRGCGSGAQCQTCPIRLAVVRTFETGQPCRHVDVAMVVTRGGIRREIQVSASTGLVRLPDHPKVVVYLEDITARKAAEERTGAQAKLLDLAWDAIAVQDLKGCVQYWNKGSERQTGWAAAEAMGRSAIELVKADRGVFDGAMRVLIKEGCWNGEQAILTKDGRALRVMSRWTLARDEQGRPKSVLAISIDVTERKKLEAQLLRAQPLEAQAPSLAKA
jgi:PAS domain S-box-containing protein